MATTLLNAGPATRVAQPADLPYAMAEPEPSSWAIWLSDRAVNRATLGWETEEGFTEWEYSSGDEMPNDWEFRIEWDGENERWYIMIFDYALGECGTADGAEDDTEVTIPWSFEDYEGEAYSGTTTFTRTETTDHCQTIDTVLLPAPREDGGARDLLLRLTVDETDKPQGETTSLSFLPADDGETLTFETEDGDLPAVEEGTWLWSFTETAPHVLAVSRKALVEIDSSGEGE